jgi:hypothetical protein
VLGLGKAQRPKYPDSCWRIRCDVFAKGAFELPDVTRVDAIPVYQLLSFQVPGGSEPIPIRAL